MMMFWDYPIDFVLSLTLSASNEVFLGLILEKKETLELYSAICRLNKQVMFYVNSCIKTSTVHFID